MSQTVLDISTSQIVDSLYAGDPIQRGLLLADLMRYKMYQPELVEAASKLLNDDAMAIYGRTVGEIADYYISFSMGEEPFVM